MGDPVFKKLFRAHRKARASVKTLGMALRFDIDLIAPQFLRGREDPPTEKLSSVSFSPLRGDDPSQLCRTLLIRPLKKTKIGNEPSVIYAEQVQAPVIDAVQLGIRTVLFHDEYVHAQAHRFVQLFECQLVKPLQSPFHRDHPFPAARI